VFRSDFAKQALSFRYGFQFITANGFRNRNRFAYLLILQESPVSIRFQPGRKRGFPSDRFRCETKGVDNETNLQQKKRRAA